MANKRKGHKIDGWLNLHKPAGITSNQALGRVKYALKPQKAGHGGTLDPLASGLLPIALGEATKTVNYVMDAVKTYHFEVTWGEQRTTDDSEGDVIKDSDKRPIYADIEALLPLFTGDIEQMPPQFSALKIDGQRAYDLARNGQKAALKARKVSIDKLQIIRNSQQNILKQDEVESTCFECVCGKGTYIRSIARDMGEKLGCYGYISRLERVKIGPFTLDHAISLDFFDDFDHKTPLETVVSPIDSVLDDIPALDLREEETASLRNGQALSFITKSDLIRLQQAGIAIKEEITALALYQGKAQALISVKGPEIRPIRIFNI